MKHKHAKGIKKHKLLKIVKNKFYVQAKNIKVHQKGIQKRSKNGAFQVQKYEKLIKFIKNIETIKMVKK